MASIPGLALSLESQPKLSKNQKKNLKKKQKKSEPTPSPIKKPEFSNQESSSKDHIQPKGHQNVKEAVASNREEPPVSVEKLNISGATSENITPTAPVSQIQNQVKTQGTGHNIQAASCGTHTDTCNENTSTQPSSIGTTDSSLSNASEMDAPRKLDDKVDGTRDQRGGSKHQREPCATENTHREQHGGQGTQSRRDNKRKHEDQKHGSGKDRSREGKSGRQDSHHGGIERQRSGDRNGGRQDSYGNKRSSEADPHRPIADQMKYNIQNSTAMKLDSYLGYVYARDLAARMNMQEAQLIQIATKYDREFEMFTDNDGSVNIGMKRFGRRDDDPDTALSKKLSGLLRHRAEHKGFKLLDGGFLFVGAILQRKEFREYTVEAVKRIVKNNDKQRFKLEDDKETGELKIRANQGHSMKVENLELRILTAKDVPSCVHGTSFDSWELIKSSGLRQMGRNHIHFAPGEPGESGVISGMRSSCQVLVFIDMDKAIADGIKFEMSANNVILSEGNKYGIISPKYFKRVTDRKSRKQMPFSKEQAKQDDGSQHNKDDKANKSPKQKGGKLDPKQESSKQSDCTKTQHSEASTGQKGNAETAEGASNTDISDANV